MPARYLKLFFLLLLGACLDPLSYDVEVQDKIGISISGNISDQPGPYTIRINKTFDIKSELYLKEPVSNAKIIISDDTGVEAELVEVEAGKYETNGSDIQGYVGRVYKIRVELDDGKVYESIPDTLLSSGTIDTIRYSYMSIRSVGGVPAYGFEINADATVGEGSPLFMFAMTGTFKAITHPELIPIGPPPAPSKAPCNPIPDSGVCNFYPLCSGLLNVGSTQRPVHIRVKPCECCECWYNIYNDRPILSDELFNQTGKYDNQKIDFIPITAWVFKEKIYVQVAIRSLSKNSFRFVKAIRDQVDGTGSLFQPVSGRIPKNFIQISGSKLDVEGLFYATSIKSKGFYILRSDIPDASVIPRLDESTSQISCLEFFPYASNKKPDFWID